MRPEEFSGTCSLTSTAKVDHSRMWALIVEHLPALIAKLENVMPELPPDE